MTDTIEIVIRTFTSFALFIIIMHILGKQLVGQITYHYFIAAITLGSIAGNMAFNIKIKFLYFIISMLLFSAIAFALAFLTLKSSTIRRWISGDPAVIIQNGKLLEDNMKKAKYTLDVLNQGLREKDIFDIEEVEHAVLEVNGKLSVLKKPEYRGVTRQDLSLSPSPGISFPVELIKEGKVLERNLDQNQLTTEWLNQELAKKGYTLPDVFYGVLSTSGRLYFDLYGEA
ncbi:DUF421 domain-containing protein [Aneurinibacillus tyrosinisolvens]|uniref:DUF421 domain-containing protein n=1 Tax=Aneurinibacillus tyrosinisolvens TaxID=1443435 RepID=UPI00063F7631|nr:DUF421 domain-containing protein [Aneurinibacillus tyrosinisolvens]